MALNEIRRKLCNQFFQTDTACVDHIAFLIDRQVFAGRFRYTGSFLEERENKYH